MKRPVPTTWLVTVFVALTMLVIVVAFLGIAQWRGIVQKNSNDALVTVAWASLDYLRETGEAPRDMNSLIEAGMLHPDPPSGMLVSGRPERYRSILAEYAVRVHSDVPRTIEGYIVRNGIVMRSDDGHEPILFDCAGIDRQMVLMHNRKLAREWYAIMAELEKPIPSTQP